MESAAVTRQVPQVPKGARKELLKSNIRSLMEKTSIDRLDERKNIEQDLKRITSLEVVDPEIEKFERERREEIKKAKEALIEIEEELEEEANRLLADL